MKEYLVHGAQTIQRASIHIILVVAKIKGYRIWVVDVKLVYLQSDRHLIRIIFIMNPETELELYPQECLELLLPIFGLAESEDEWHQALDHHVQIDLKMNPTIINPSLYCLFEDDKSIGINVGYVDDFLQAGKNVWQTQSDVTLRRFETDRNQKTLFTFTGMYLSNQTTGITLIKIYI